MNGIGSAIAKSAFGIAMVVGATSSADATVINLAASGVAGHGSLFCGAGNAGDVTVVAGGYKVVLSGGVALGPNISFLPADPGILYGTSDFANGCGQSGYTNPITVSFFDAVTNAPKNVTNFFIDLFNGNTVPVDYTLADNLSNSASFVIASNAASGVHTFGFAAAGDVMTITGGPAPNGCCAWDYFVDNIGFNQAIPTGAPEPFTLSVFGMGLIGAAGLRRLRKA